MSNGATLSLPGYAGSAQTRNGQLRFFVHGVLFSTLFLQKFGFAFGHSFILLALPVCFVLWGWMIASGNVRINSRSLILYSMLVCSVLLDATIVSLNPEKLDTFSVPSVTLLIVLYSLFIFEPSEKIDTSIVVDIYLKYTMALALLGIFQYTAQFAGFRISSLGSFIPALQPLLIENFFNSNAILEYGSANVRSNAIFLLEPAGFSQLLVSALVVEFFVKRRLKFLPLYLAAYITTFSGTGLLSLIVAVVFSAFFSVRDAMRLPLIALCGAVLVGAVVVAAPGVANKYVQRLGEFNSVQSSAYFRYIAQERVWSNMIDDGSILTGNGPGSFERTYGKDKIASNAALKLTHDYGLFPMGICFALVATTIWLPGARTLSLLYLTTYQLAGAAELSINFLALTLILCVWGVKHSRFGSTGHPRPVRTTRAARATMVSNASYDEQAP